VGFGFRGFVVGFSWFVCRGADIILVMEHGRIVEKGSHHELLSRDGPYYRLYNSQFVAPLAELDPVNAT
jgi:ATP-binding cassette subfamily B protein